MSFSAEKAYYENVRFEAFFGQKLIKTVAGRRLEKYGASKPPPLSPDQRKVWTEEQTIAGED